jgi:hypothetical protein
MHSVIILLFNRRKLEKQKNACRNHLHFASVGLAFQLQGCNEMSIHIGT